MTWAQGQQLGTDLASSQGSQEGGRALPRSSEERPGRSRWRWSPGTKEKDHKAKLNHAPNRANGGPGVGLATVPFGAVARLSVSYEYRVRGREVFTSNDRKTHVKE